MSAPVAETVQAAVTRAIAHSVGMSIDVQRDEPLLSSGVLDSLSLVGLIEELGRDFGVVLDPLDVTLENFDTVARIERFITERMRDE